MKRTTINMMFHADDEIVDNDESIVLSDSRTMCTLCV